MPESTDHPNRATACSVQYGGPNRVSRPDEGRFDRPLILLADDEGDVNLVTKTRLEANGFEVMTALDGEEALSLFRARRPDLVLLDLKMPKLDGYRFCEIVKGDPASRSVPVILFSASSSHSQELRDKCLELGADDHIRKPYAADELIAKVRRHLKPKTRSSTADIG